MKSIKPMKTALEAIKPIIVNGEELNVLSKTYVPVKEKYNEIMSLTDERATVVNLKGEPSDNGTVIVMEFLLKNGEAEHSVDVPVAISDNETAINAIASSIQVLHAGRENNVPVLTLENGMALIPNEDAIERFMTELKAEFPNSELVATPENTGDFNKANVTADGETIATLTTDSPESIPVFTGEFNRVAELLPLNELVIQCLENGTNATVFSMTPDKIEAKVFAFMDAGFKRLNDNAYVYVGEAGRADFLLNIRMPMEGEPLGMIELQTSIYSSLTVNELMAKL